MAGSSSAAGIDRLTLWLAGSSSAAGISRLALWLAVTRAGITGEIRKTSSAILATPIEENRDLRMHAHLFVQGPVLKIGAGPRGGSGIFVDMPSMSEMSVGSVPNSATRTYLANGFPNSSVQNKSVQHPEVADRTSCNPICGIQGAPKTCRIYLQTSEDTMRTSSATSENHCNTKLGFR